MESPRGLPAHADARHLPSADFPIFDPDTYYSFHPGGCHFLFGDGSVRFIAYTIDVATWRALGTRNGSEVVNKDY